MIQLWTQSHPEYRSMYIRKKQNLIDFWNGRLDPGIIDIPIIYKLLTIKPCLITIDTLGYFLWYLRMIPLKVTLSSIFIWFLKFLHAYLTKQLLNIIKNIEKSFKTIKLFRLQNSLNKLMKITRRYLFCCQSWSVYITYSFTSVIFVTTYSVQTSIFMRFCPDFLIVTKVWYWKFTNPLLEFSNLIFYLLLVRLVFIHLL